MSVKPTGGRVQPVKVGQSSPIEPRSTVAENAPQPKNEVAFEPGGARTNADADIRAEFLSTHQAGRPQSVGWSEVPAGAMPSQLAIAEYRRWSAEVHEVGLRPSRVMIGRAEPGEPQTQWLTLLDEQGRAAVAWVVRTSDGQAPPGLLPLLEDLGVQPGPLDEAAVKGATPVRPLADKSPRAEYDRAHRLADTLMRHAGFDPNDDRYAMMRYATARYLLNATTPEQLAFLAQHFDGSAQDLMQTGQVPARWVEKLERTFQEPYTNDEAMAWLKELAQKLPAAAAFIKQANVNNAPIEFFALGSLTKARFGGVPSSEGREGSGSDMDVGFDTPDKELEKKILQSEFGFLGGNSEVFSFINVGYYHDRTKYFGVPAPLTKSVDALGNPATMIDFYKASSREWGLELNESSGGTKVNVLPHAKDRFMREAPIVTEVLYDYSREYRRQVPTSWVTAHWEALVANAGDVRLMSRQRLEQLGERLVADRLATSGVRQAIERYLTTDAGKKALANAGKTAEEALRGDVAKLIGPMNLDDALGFTDPVERLMVDFAAAARMKALAEQERPTDQAFSAELEAALS